MARVLALVPDLMLASRVEATLAGAGHEVTVRLDAGRADLAGRPTSSSRTWATSTRAAVAGQGVPVLGFYRHTDPETRARAEAAGVDLVVPRSRLAREMPELVDRLLSAD